MTKLDSTPKIAWDSNLFLACNIYKFSNCEAVYFSQERYANGRNSSLAFLSAYKSTLGANSLAKDLPVRSMRSIIELANPKPMRLTL